jgi:hypothetical protein
VLFAKSAKKAQIPAQCAWTFVWIAAILAFVLNAVDIWREMNSNLDIAAIATLQKTEVNILKILKNLTEV